MANSRREKTFADYVVIAISPVLIMALVGSLAFFLTELSYRGQYEVRLKWILFCFVTAAVLVARIAIEQGKEHASIYAVAMLGVTGFAALRLVEDAVIIAWTLLAIIWWCSWKLTWDCTLIDDTEDASGEGLLQAMAGTQNVPAVDPLKSTIDDAHKMPVARKTLLEERSLDGNRPASPRRPHSPGLWVVYFSLAALPLFGAGQLLIPVANTDGREYAFRLLALYVAAALGLLLTTSFLGLRRYLRQRKLQMPLSMTGAWLGMGTGLAMMLLLLALLIPRPQGGEYTLTALIDKVDAKVQQASRFAVVRGDRAEGAGRRVGQQDQRADKPAEGQPPDQKHADQNAGEKKGDQADGKNGGAQKKAGPAADRDKKDDAKADGKGNGNGEQKQEQAAAKQDRADRPPKEPPGDSKAAPPPAPSKSNSSNLFAWLAPLVKWIIYGLLAAAGMYVLFRHWSQLIEVLAKLWAALLGLFVSKSETPGRHAGDEETPPARRRPFASFEDPFFSGAARRMPPAQLVIYTFEALEAWAREQIVERPTEQTPLEFAQELGRRVPALAKDVTQTTQLYVRVAYSQKNPSGDFLETLERMWRRMGISTGA